jgi:hypothetical protein
MKAMKLKTLNCKRWRLKQGDRRKQQTFFAWKSISVRKTSGNQQN